MLYEVITNSQKQSVPSNIAQCESFVKGVFCNSFDIVIESFDTNKDKALIVYVDGLTDKDLIDRDIIRPLKSTHFNGDVGKALYATFTETEDLRNNFV